MTVARCWLSIGSVMMLSTACERIGPEVPPWAPPDATGLAPAEAADEPGYARLDDATIAEAVQRQLAGDGAVPDTIVARSTDGIVSLTGAATNMLAAERAVRLAETVRGVKVVDDDIVVTPPDRPDPELQRDIGRALLHDPAAESYEVDVTVRDGEVTLAGKVDSWVEHQHAERLAKGVRGVRRVDNALEVDYPEIRSEYELTTDIENRLRWDALVDESTIAVAVDGDRVVLSGRVGSLAEKRRASADAWAYGVGEVVAALEIDPTLRDGQREVDRPVVPDGEIEDAIELAAAYDPRVLSFEITPIVEGGIAILTGRVENLKAKIAAEEIARNTVGVLAVNNHIQVDPVPTGTDADARRRLEMALAIDPITEAYEIDVDVEDGLATLTGTVDNYAELAEATDVALGVRGIAWIENDLVVAEDRVFVHNPYVFPFHPYVPWGWYVASSSAEDAEIESDIERELFWSPFVDADEVHVEVRDGVATLTGEVDSWRERSSAAENAFEGGAVSVDNELDVG